MDLDITVAKLELLPGDFLLFKTEMLVSKQAAMDLRENIRRLLPPGVEFMLVTHGVGVTRVLAKDVPLEWRQATK